MHIFYVSVYFDTFCGCCSSGSAILEMNVIFTCLQFLFYCSNDRGIASRKLCDRLISYKSKNCSCSLDKMFSVTCWCGLYTSKAFFLNLEWQLGGTRFHFVPVRHATRMRENRKNEPLSLFLPSAHVHSLPLHSCINCPFVLSGW